MVEVRQHGAIPLDVKIAVPAGQTLALVGPSGAGKSTILRAVAGLYRPDKGRILCGDATWLDRDRGVDVAPQRRRVGLVFQSYALFPHMTAAENVAEAMFELPRAERAARATELLHRVHLEGMNKRLPSALSGGQQQRVALARALAREPQVLLLDEPFSAVDHPTRRSLHRLITEIRAMTAIPIVIVSHDIEDAVRSADQLCFLRSGSTLEQGPTQALLDDANSQVSRWLVEGS